MLDTCPIEVEFLPSDDLLDMIVMVQSGGHEVMTRVRHTHTNIARIEKDGQVLEDHMEAAQSGGTQDENLLTIQQICEFAACVELDDVREPLERQLQYNMAIARRGLEEPYGAQVGQTLLSVYGNGVRNRAKAMAAAGSDARMSGCELPVVINSGSGNQGLTVSGACGCLCGGISQDAGGTVPCAGRFQPDGHPPKDDDWQAFGVLRRGYGGRRRRRRHCMATDAGFFHSCAHDRQRAGHCFWHHLRRREGLLRGENRFRGGCGHYGL